MVAVSAAAKERRREAKRLHIQKVRQAAKADEERKARNRAKSNKSYQKKKMETPKNKPIVGRGWHSTGKIDLASLTPCEETRIHPLRKEVLGKPPRSFVEATRSYVEATRNYVEATRKQSKAKRQASRPDATPPPATPTPGRRRG